MGIFLPLYLLIFTFFSFANAESIFESPCIETVQLSDEEAGIVLEKASVDVARFSRVIVQRTVLKSRECVAQTAKLTGITEEPFTTTRSIRAWSLPKLAQESLCKIDYTEYHKLDHQWSNAKARTQTTYAYLLQDSEPNCLDISLEEYIPSYTDIPDTELIRLLKNIPEIVNIFSLAEKKQAKALRVTGIGVSTLKTRETYYSYYITEYPRPRPYKVFIDWRNGIEASIIQTLH